MLTPSILTAVFPHYLPGCFPLAFLEVHHPILSSEEIVLISLCLDPIVWESLATSKRVAFSTNTLFQSCWRYSNHFFLFSFSTSLLFLAVFLTLVFTTFLAFWAACSIWQASAASSKWVWSYCSSLCLLCISHHCSSSISASYCEISERIGEDMVIQKKTKNFLVGLYIVDLGTITEFFG